MRQRTLQGRRYSLPAPEWEIGKLHNDTNGDQRECDGVKHGEDDVAAVSSAISTVGWTRNPSAPEAPTLGAG
jgi:hypothetical protein